MSDLGCWRCGENVVVRIRGNEHLFSYRQLSELIGHLLVVKEGGAESLGNDYIQLQESNRRARMGQPSQFAADLEAALGLTPPAKLRRI